MNNFYCIIISLFFMFSTLVLASDPSKIIGPDECTECHDVENSIWEKTHHFETFENMPEQDEALSIAEKLTIEDVIESDICQNCHLTLQTDDGETDVIAGVSCESCHGAGKEWYEVHSEEDKTAEQEKTLWAKSEAAGMIRPGNIVKLAGNCLDCHLVKNEKLVNIGGHEAGSDFNLVSWSQGEIRHNTFHSKDGENRKASATKLRKMLVIGAVLELQKAIEAYSEAKDKNGKYAVAMLARANKSKALIEKITETNTSTELKSLKTTVAQLDTSKLEAVSELSKKLLMVAKQVQNAPSQDWGDLDKIISGLGETKGKAQE